MSLFLQQDAMTRIGVLFSLLHIPEYDGWKGASMLLCHEPRAKRPLALHQNTTIFHASVEYSSPLSLASCGRKDRH
jgi:hypothetical protein